MSASLYDFSIEKGSSYTLTIKIKDSSKQTVPLTNYCARLCWQTNNGVTQEFYTSDTPNSNYKFFIDAPNGSINLMLSANFTNSLSFLNAKYDLELEYPSDLYSGGGKIIDRILFGTIKLVKRFSNSSTIMDCN
jgi:hypothetical protein